MNMKAYGGKVVYQYQGKNNGLVDYLIPNPERGNNKLFFCKIAMEIN